MTRRLSPARTIQALTCAAAVATSATAYAHEPETSVHYDPAYASFIAPGDTSDGFGRIRVLTNPQHGRAALTLNQVDAYQQAFRRHFVRLSQRMPLSQAEARARHAAWHEVLGGAKRINVDALDLGPLQAGGRRTLFSK